MFSERNKSKFGTLLWQIIEAEKEIRKLNFEEGIKKHLSFADKIETNLQKRYASWSYLRAGIIFARPSTPYIKKIEALTYYNKGLQIAINAKDTSEIIRAYVYIGEYFLDVKSHENAEKNLKQAENLLLKFKDKNLFPTTYASLGSSALLNQNVGLANSYFSKMQYWLDNSGFNYKEFYYSYISNIKYLGLANFYFDKKDFKMAAKFAEKGYQELQGFKSEKNKRSYHTYVVDHLKILSLSNEKIGNIPKAFGYLKEYQEILNENNQNELNKDFQSLNMKFQAQQKDIKKKELENHNKIEAQKKIEIMLIGLIIFLLFAMLSLIRSRKRLKEKNQHISEALLKGQTLERQRVAMDLHDNLGGTLSGLMMNFESIDKSKMDVDNLLVFQNLKENLEKTYQEVRLLSHNLLPSEFAKQGLVASIQGLVRKISKNANIKFDLQIDEAFGRVDPKIEFELYSICMELVNNIMKHSKASNAKIVLNRSEKAIELWVSDNGIGTFSNESDGKGLKNVKSRVASMNGTWEIDNASKTGVMNKITIPLK